MEVLSASLLQALTTIWELIETEMMIKLMTSYTNSFVEPFSDLIKPSAACFVALVIWAVREQQFVYECSALLLPAVQQGAAALFLITVRRLWPKQ